MLLSIQGYDFKLHYVRSEDNIADYTSRNPQVSNNRVTDRNENYVNFVSKLAMPNAITIDKVKSETKKDKFIQTLINIKLKDNWHVLDESDKHSFLKDLNISDLKRFRKFKHAINADRDIILKGTRIVLPTSLHKVAVMLAHSGHQGVRKPKV